MSLDKHYILEVYKEIPYEPDVELSRGKKWVHAYYRIECNGNIRDGDMVYPIDKWEEIKERGYYLG